MKCPELVNTESKPHSASVVNDEKDKFYASDVTILYCNGITLFDLNQWCDNFLQTMDSSWQLFTNDN